MSRFRDFLRRYEVLAWAGLVVGLASVLGLRFGPLNVSPLVFWTGVIAAALVTIFSAIHLITHRNREPLVCLSCDKSYLIEGPHGHATTLYEVARYRARQNLPYFTHMIRSGNGTWSSKAFSYRNLGKDSGRSPAPGFYPLGAASGVIFQRPDPDREVVIIQPPTAIKKGEVFEVRYDGVVQDAFPAEQESVAKSVLYPTSKLSFNLEFRGGNPLHPAGAIYAVRPEAEEWRQIDVVDSGGHRQINHTFYNAVPDRTYQVSWRWS